MPIASINPATGETMRTFEPLAWEALDAKLEQAAAAFKTYRCTSYRDRAGCMAAAGEILEGEKEQLGRLMTLEMGKPFKAGISEAEKCAWVCRYYAEYGEALLADEEVATDAERSYVHYQPLGAVLAIMPWNFPFWQAFRFIAPGLMAGNVGLLKHASNVPQCALAIEDILHRAGFPEGVFQTLLIGSDLIPQILNDPRIAAATLTGSEAAGGSVASVAGKRIKKTVMELGGSDPFIVLPTADMDRAVQTAIRARIINNGESCIAAKRFIIHDAIYDEFERRMVLGMQELRVGDPMDPATEVGPLATPAIVEDLDRQVQRSVELGARLLTGGRRLPGPGNYYQPTVLAGIPKVSPAYLEELFGPVALLFRVADLDEAIAVANDTEFGLGSSAWTNDMAERERLIDEIQAGMVFINGMVASDPRLPFGGVKHSGYGRELGAFGIREFTNVKTVWIGDGQNGGHRSAAE
jgi:succinate-semialdehyde dehydrogenase / glutarate-semialdehyde dehydrogenase